jgi:hypothetical protein
MTNRRQETTIWAVTRCGDKTSVVIWESCCFLRNKRILPVWSGSLLEAETPGFSVPENLSIRFRGVDSLPSPSLLRVIGIAFQVSAGTLLRHKTGTLEPGTLKAFHWVRSRLLCAYGRLGIVRLAHSNWPLMSSGMRLCFIHHEHLTVLWTT